MMEACYQLVMKTPQEKQILMRGTFSPNRVATRVILVPKTGDEFFVPKGIMVQSASKNIVYYGGYDYGYNGNT